MQPNVIYAGGLNLDFFPSMDLEPTNPKKAQKSEELLPQARNMLRLYMGGWRDNWLKKLLTGRVFKAQFLARDHELNQAIRLAFHEGFQHIFSQLEGRELTLEQRHQAQLYISNCLCYLPYFDMSPYEFVALPQYINDRWVMVDYKVTPLELTPKSGFKKLFMTEYDRIFAYGLEPINQLDAEPQLVFMGTSYPGGLGFFSAIETDLEAFETAGKKLYRGGHRAISDWIARQPNKPHVCGHSLGGALALLVAIDQGHKIARVDALNPPGLYHPFLRKSRFDHWDDIEPEDKPEVYIQKQRHDPVSRFGEWKADWHILEVIPQKDKEGPESAAHELNYAGFAETQFIGVDTAKDNAERKSRNLWLYALLRSAAYYLLIVPFRYAILPAIRFIASKKGLYTLAAGLIIAASLFFFPPLTAIIVMGVVSLPILAYVGYKLPHGLSTLFGFNKVTRPHAQDPTLPRNESLDLYSKTNTLEAQFSYRDLSYYYQAQRCDLKNKEFFPEHNPEANNFKNTGLSKHDLLENSRDEERAKEKITIRATKAKVHDMNKIIHIAHQIGFHKKDKPRLHAELASSREDYLAGKIVAPVQP